MFVQQFEKQLLLLYSESLRNNKLKIQFLKITQQVMHPLQAMFLRIVWRRIFKVRIAFEIASTPVKAELPDANALSNKIN